MNTKVEEIEENGEIYIVTTYIDDGGSIFAVDKYTKSENEPPEIVYLSETEKAILETAINTEYLTCLAELAL